MICRTSFLGAIAGLFGVSPAFAAWTPQHTVIVVLENQTASQVLADPQTPFIHSLAREGARMTNAHFARTPYSIGNAGALPARPSQPNYLYLFSGHHQGVLPEWNSGIGNGLIPAALRPFHTPNLGSAIRAAGGTYAGFSESLPYPHYDAEDDPDPAQDFYRRKHNPTINWVNLNSVAMDPAQQRFVLPITTHLAFDSTHDPVDQRDYRGFAADARGRPIGYDQLPTIAIVVPNEQHDAHSNSNSACDAWLTKHIKPYGDWAREHDSLLILTYDEDGSTDTSHGDPYRTGMDRILTVFSGPPSKVIPGAYAERIDHLNVLATVLNQQGALSQFRKDFLRAYATPESKAEYRNLRPILDVFGEGAALDPLTAK